MRTRVRSRRVVAALAVALAVALIATACGDAGDTPASTAGSPTTTAGPPKPQRIVSLAPSATEMLYAIGAGGQVIAVDDQSNYPAQAPKTDLSGFTPNAEAIVAKQPDLVVLSDDLEGIVAKLQTLKIATIRLPAAKSIAESYSQMEQLGAATGNVGGAAEAVLKMRTSIDDIVKRAPKPP
jgi:iron complex transport system substrate-binding protein